MMSHKNMNCIEFWSGSFWRQNSQPSCLPF